MDVFYGRINSSTIFQKKKKKKNSHELAIVSALLSEMKNKRDFDTVSSFL